MRLTTESAEAHGMKSRKTMQKAFARCPFSTDADHSMGLNPPVCPIPAIQGRRAVPSVPSGLPPPPFPFRCFSGASVVKLFIFLRRSAIPHG